MTGSGRATDSGDVGRLAQERADGAEADSISRFRLLTGLGDAIDEAVRRAEASLRLENALRYACGTPSPR